MVKKTYINKTIKDFIVTAVVSILIAFGVRQYVFAREDVSGPSMMPTLVNNDTLFAEKLSLITGNIKRGQIITFDSGNANHDIYVKRVIAVEGDEIELTNGKVFLNGNELNEPYLTKGLTTNAGTYLHENEKIKIKKGFVFVLGDNRTVSYDSRYFGPVNLKAINGHVVLRVYPFNKIKGF